MWTSQGLNQGPPDFELLRRTYFVIACGSPSLYIFNFYNLLILGERSTFVDDAKWRQENASWLRRSRRVAYAIMDYMQDNGLSRNDVAEKLGVSPQYVSKILSGKVNFSFKTISEIEEGLGIEVFQAAAMEA